MPDARSDAAAPPKKRKRSPTPPARNKDRIGNKVEAEAEGADAGGLPAAPAPVRRGRSPAPPLPAPTAQKSGPRSADHDKDDHLPQPYDAQALHPPKRRAVSPSEPPRKLKRPGARARISEADRDAISQRQAERQREADAAAARAAALAAAAGLQRGINDVVRQHYNNVPERGRDWRRTDSRIRGLRSFNNWIKSCIIQKFSPDDDHAPGSRERALSSRGRLLVLDMGCGKGGDLPKWQQAPQPVELYVGVDPADISIQQARARYESMGARDRGGGRAGGRRFPPPPLFDGMFFVKDCFGEPIEQLDIVRKVGFDPSTMNHRGFDVVSIMFAIHYAFETEQKARSMLRNVAGALKKGGRFIGCIPNSDVIGARVREFNAKIGGNKPQGKKADPTQAEVGGVGEKEGEEAGPEMKEPGEAGPEMKAGEVGPEMQKEGESGLEEGEEKEEGEAEAEEPTAEWGNSIYHVRFPGPTPADGVFRPAFGWRYSFFLDEAVEEVPEYVVPWEAFRALAEDFNLELQYHKPFLDVWETEKNDQMLGPLSERMGVRGRGRGDLLITPEEREAVGFYSAFCFYKV